PTRYETTNENTSAFKCAAFGRSVDDRRPIPIGRRRIRRCGDPSRTGPRGCSGPRSEAGQQQCKTKRNLTTLASQPTSCLSDDLSQSARLQHDMGGNYQQNICRSQVARDQATTCSRTTRGSCP